MFLYRYVEFRRWCNLSLVENWSDLKNIMPRKVINKLKDLYGHPGWSFSLLTVSNDLLWLKETNFRPL